MDALSEVLRMIRLQGALFLNGQFHEPWCVQTPRAADMAHLLCPGASRLAILHMALEGRCWVQLPGAEPIAMEAGDVIALPAGDAHLIGSGLRHAPVDPRHALRVKLPELAPMRYGGDGDAVRLVCGWFAYERDVPNPLLTALPAVFRVALGRRPAGPWIEQSLRYALQEAAAGHPGSAAVAAKVAESMFVETLRAYLEDLPPQQSGWLGGLRDPQVGHCLALMHDQPARAWSLDTLAQEVHTSRSVLAERFSELLGMPPMKYLKRWRLSVAARMLCSERSNLIQVAEAVGYESEASFSRAFKSEFGVPPGAWRSSGRVGTDERPS
jgi:AraC-like DNA-binding protein